MRRNDRFLPLPQTPGRKMPCRVVVNPFSDGTTEYLLQRNPGTPYQHHTHLLVQGTPYHHPHEAPSGIPVEALYAIVGNELEIEHGTVSEGKQAIIARSRALLVESLRLYQLSTQIVNEGADDAETRPED